ncbi:MAG: hypothetical protein L0956_02855 [Candidatus Mariimomonas ferrooxydans]
MDSPFLNIAMYAVVNLLLFFSWYALLFKKKYCLSFADRLIGTFILGLTQIIATEIVLGVIFKNLSSSPLFWINISVSSVVIVSVLLSGRQMPFNKENGMFRQGLIKDILHEFKDRTAGMLRVIRGDRILFWIFSLFFISVCWIIF